MEKALKLYNSNGAFPSAENQIEMLGFNYDAKRMGGAPMISGTVMYGSCLDGVWSDDVYIEFNHEKYYLKQTPTSSFSHKDARYKHECEFVSERIKLDNVYFFDTVVGDPQGYDKPVSNSSVFSFFGNIREFAKRLNASLQYSKLQTKNDDGTYSGYIVVVNDDVDNEEKLLSFSNVPFSTALQESYNQFEIPYYFVGKEIHFGYWQNAIKDAFRYGVDKELLSITKTNANQKVITRCTGMGGTENIPYYYPNEHPQGELKPLYNDESGVVSIEDDALFAENTLYTDKIEYTEYEVNDIDGLKVELYEIRDYKNYKDTVANKGLIGTSWINDGEWYLAPTANFTEELKSEYSTAALGGYKSYDKTRGESINISTKNNAIAFRITFDEKYFVPNPATDDVLKDNRFTLSFKDMGSQRLWGDRNAKIAIVYRSGSSTYKISYKDSAWQTEDYFSILEQWFNDNLRNTHDKAVYVVFTLQTNPKNGVTIKPTISVSFKDKQIKKDWKKSGRIVELKDLGLYTNKKPSVGDVVSFEQVRYVQPMPNLMPPVYWESNGAERFYNAVNNTYDNPDTGEKYTFQNPYSDSKRVEHIVEFPDIKPTIEGMTNNAGQPINAFLEFAYDKEDNDAIDKDGNYVHPYFYAKLPKFDSFNLFTHANEKGEVTFSMKSGNCGACNFVLGVDSESGKNTVQVDKNGKLIYVDGKVKLGVPQERQNDTKNNEVWVALKKDNSTFGTIMPNAQHKYYPAAGDTFVLLNITMPIEYVQAAENRLKEEIIKYMYENNAEKFSFSIKFSRIYLAENPQIFDKLNENAFITVEYNGVKHPLYVNSFAYKMTAGEALPEITVELAETLSASMNAIQAAVSQVKTDVLDRVQKMDIAAMVAANFLSKNNEDYAKQKITFNRGLSVGTQDNEVAKIDQAGHADIESATLKQHISSPNFRDGFSGEGFKMWLDENGLAHLTVDTLTARQRMVIYEMLISKIRSVNGQLWVSAANGTIAKVVERENDFEITLEDDNTFMVGDYMRCQVFSGADFRSYWVEISGVDGGRLYVAKSEFGEVLPQEGDDVILCGSKQIGRQNAIHISATEDGQPRISLYNGIATKDLAGCLRTQLGNLDNIEDDVLNPQGDGLYSDNVYLKGDFILRNRNTNVETVFEIQDGKIKGGIAQTQTEAIRGKSYLYNASFIDGLKGWLTSNEESVYFSGEALLFDSSSLLYQSVSISSEPIYENVFFVTINNGWITQSNLYFINKPEFNSEKQYPLLFSVNARCRTAGELLVKVGEQEILKLWLEPSDKFVEINKDDKTWNGTGDFHLSFTGDADFYGLTIYTEKTEVRHKTFFDMSDRLINFGAQQLDEGGNIKKESGIMVKPNEAGIYAFNGETGQYASIGVADGNKVKLTGEKIILEGDVSANGNVHIDAKTGTLTAKGAILENAIFETGGDDNTYKTTITNTGIDITNGDTSLGKLETAKTVFVGNVAYPRLLFTDGTNDNYTQLMYNQLIFKQYQNVEGLGYHNNAIVITAGAMTAQKYDEQNKVTSSLGINSDGISGDFAINGSVQLNGIRMKPRVVTSDATIDVLDNFIIADNASAITLTLPKNANNGQVYTIATLNNDSAVNTTIKVDDSSNDTIVGKYSNKGEKSTTISKTDKLQLVYCAELNYWIATLMGRQ